MKRPAARILESLSIVPIHGLALTIVGLLLISAGQPLFTEDTWWHLAMGSAYAEFGPWLKADPVLHTANGPAAPAAWLSQISVYYIERGFGFTGLRVTHASFVVGILALAWMGLARVSRSRIYASAGLIAFAILSSYRLFQMRPHLVSISIALIAIGILVVPPRAAVSRFRIGICVGLFAIWANSHAGFLLGPILLAAATAGSW